MGLMSRQDYGRIELGYSCPQRGASCACALGLSDSVPGLHLTLDVRWRLSQAWLTGV